MRIIDEKEAYDLGITTIHHEMENGEKRFRLISNTGSSYILTISPNESCWQNSHYHNDKKEFYVVEKGKATLVLWNGIDEPQIIELNENDCYFVDVKMKHNLYVEKNSILHTIKYGTKENDWNECKELDEYIQKRIKL